MKICSCVGCDRVAQSRGLCNAHYQRFKTQEVFDPSPIREPGAWVNGGPCSVESCTRTAHVRGLCDRHYDRLLYGGDVRADVPIVEQAFPPIDFCRCPAPQPEPVGIGHVLIPGAFQCSACHRGIR